MIVCLFENLKRKAVKSLVYIVYFLSIMSASATRYMCPARPGFECEFQEKNSEEVCKYCGRTGRRTIYTGAAKMFDPEDEKNLTSDTGKYLGPPSTKMGEVFTSNASVLNPGYKARDRSIVSSMKVCLKLL